MEKDVRQSGETISQRKDAVMPQKESRTASAFSGAGDIPGSGETGLLPAEIKVPGKLASPSIIFTGPLSHTDVERQLMDGYPMTSGRRYAIARESSLAAYEVLHHENIPTMMTVVESMRRINTLFHGSRRMQQQGYYAPEVSLQRTDDMVFDLASFKNTTVPREEVQKTIRKLGSLEFCFQPMIADFTRRWNHWNKKDEVEHLANTLVTRAVWGRWTTQSQEPAQAVNDMRKFVVGYLNQLYRYIQKWPVEKTPAGYASEKKGVRDFDEFLEYHAVENPFEERVPQKNNNEEMLDQWRDAIGNLSLADVFRVMGHMPPALRLPLLDSCGYLEEGKQTDNRLAHWNVSQFTYDTRLREACVQFMELLDAPVPQETAEPTASIADMVGETRTQGVYFLNDRAAPLHDTRMRLLNLAPSDPLWKQLTNTEKAVAQLAAANYNNTFTHDTYADVACAAGVSTPSVNKAMARIGQILDGTASPQYVSTSGRRIAPLSTHASLLALHTSATEEQLSALTPLEQTFLGIVTRPSAEGRYTPVREAMRMVGSTNKNLPRNVAKTLQETAWHTTLKQQLERALNDAAESGLTPSEQSLAMHILTLIHEGKAVSSRNRSSLALQRLCAEAYVSRSVGVSLLKKIGYY